MLLSLAILFLAQAGQGQDSLGASDLLHRSALRGETSAVDMLLKMGADPNVRDKHDRTALHDACLKDKADTARLLLDRGAKINVRDENGATPLHDAALGGGVKTIELLLSRKAEINATDREFLTPLDYALKMDRSDAARILKEAGGLPRKKLRIDLHLIPTR